ncbi:MAG TPA: ku family containing domain-containing protein [Casimicrobiaceae bacterium]|jgi:hypothetical protein|nr:ku family containing domain-containing protein [Casimicrobiaceae bacterium]
MPDRATQKRVAADKRKGKSASTQAGEFVKEEMDHVREGKHGARSAKQAIAIGLSKARRAGVAVKTSKTASAATRKKAQQDEAAAHDGRAPSRRRSRATESALEREGHAAASHRALSRHAKTASRRRTAADRSAAAKRAARTRASTH